MQYASDLMNRISGGNYICISFSNYFACLDVQHMFYMFHEGKQAKETVAAILLQMHFCDMQSCIHWVGFEPPLRPSQQCLQMGDFAPLPGFG